MAWKKQFSRFRTVSPPLPAVHLKRKGCQSSHPAAFVSGSGPTFIAILYEIDEPRQIVWVLTIRHGARDALVERERAKAFNMA